jgi:hypothetical protein
MFMQESRIVALPYVGVAWKAVMPPVRVIVVPLEQDELAPVVEEVELGVPLPRIATPMPLGTVRPLVQVQEPEGILIMSPFTAVCVLGVHVPDPLLMHALTSLKLQEAAV